MLCQALRLWINRIHVCLCEMRPKGERSNSSKDVRGFFSPHSKRAGKSLADTGKVHVNVAADLCMKYPCPTASSSIFSLHQSGKSLKPFYTMHSRLLTYLFLHFFNVITALFVTGTLNSSEFNLTHIIEQQVCQQRPCKRPKELFKTHLRTSLISNTSFVIKSNPNHFQLQRPNRTGDLK